VFPGPSIITSKLAAGVEAGTPAVQLSALLQLAFDPAPVQVVCAQALTFPEQRAPESDGQAPPPISGMMDYDERAMPRGRPTWDQVAHKCPAYRRRQYEPSCSCCRAGWIASTAPVFLDSARVKAPVYAGDS
jgi:hypothetical protein